MENPYAGKSRAEIERQLELARMQLAELDAMEAKARAAGEVKENIAAAALFKWAYSLLQSRGKLGERFADIPAPAFPREAVLARAADLSESEVAKVKKAVMDAVMAAVKG